MIFVIIMHVAFSSRSSAISQLFATFSYFHAVDLINLGDASVSEDCDLNDVEIRLEY